MKKMLIKVMPPLLLLLIAPAIPILAVNGQIVGTNTSQLDSFHQAMQKALIDQETRVKNLTARATDRSNAPLSFDKVALGNAMIMLDVKRTLVNNFWDNPVTQNTGFQQRLINILNKDLITEGDLSELQNAADQIRASSIRQAVQPQTTQPVQSPTVVQPSSPTTQQTSQSTQPNQITQPTQTSQPLPIVLPPSPQPGVIPAQAPAPQR